MLILLQRKEAQGSGTTRATIANRQHPRTNTTLFDELKRYVGFQADDEAALRGLHGVAAPEFERIADVFFRRILDHDGARKVLTGESQVGRLKVTLRQWMHELLTGPWDEVYYDRRSQIGRTHVRVALPQHYMFGAMNIIRQEINQLIDRYYLNRPEDLRAARLALGKILDLELAIMLHTYREDLLSQQARAERLSTVGQLVGAIGHELRTPLSVMEGSIFLLKSRIGVDERASKHIAVISEQLNIANDIVTKLLEMIRDRPLVRNDVNLGEVIGDVLASMPRPQGVQIVGEGLSGLPLVPADAAQLRQVFLNLLSNAVDATSPRGTVRIVGAVERPVVEVAIEDTGPGVDAAIRSRLFEPLITTKSKGIGLGLALVKRILERHGGSIAYRASSLGGACFAVRLPIFARVG